MVLVFGGTLGVGIAGGLLRDLKTIVAGLKKALLGGSKPPTDTIAEIVSLAERARREGLLALEEAIGSVEDEFLKDSLQSAVDGTDPEDLRAIMLEPDRRPRPPATRSPRSSSPTWAPSPRPSASSAPSSAWSTCWRT